MATIATYLVKYSILSVQQLSVKSIVKKIGVSTKSLCFILIGFSVILIHFSPFILKINIDLTFNITLNPKNEFGSFGDRWK